MAESAYPKRTWHLIHEWIWRKDEHLMYYKYLFCHESEKERKWSWGGGEVGRSLEKLREEKPELGFSRDYR